MPYVGLPQESDTQRRLEAEREHAGRVLGGLVTQPDRWDVHRMRGRFEHERGSCWTWRCPRELTTGDSPEASTSSTIILEDDRVLGPAHSLHDDIRTQGRGRFSHWRSEIYFSTPDGTDPNTNGRCYTAIVQK
jgi:hypothetical protein